MQLGSVTPQQFEEIERQVTEDLGLTAAALNENAAFAVAQQARTMLGATANRQVVILTGGGHNGLIGVAAGRKLASWGATVTILLAATRTELERLTEQELGLAEQYGVRIFDPGALVPPAELLIDALIGSSLQDTLTGEYASLAATASKVKIPILSIDLPSGLDANTGKANQPAIRADVTVALGYPKTGVTKPFAAQLVGQLLVADIGIPPRLWQQFGQPAPDFSEGPLVAID